MNDLENRKLTDEEIRSALKTHANSINDIADMMISMNRHLLDLYTQLAIRVKKLGEHTHE